MAKLALICLDNYSQDDLDRCFQAAFAELGLAACFKPEENILIKPNLLAGVSPEKAVTPHPSVFEALAKSLGELRVHLSYGDSPAMDSTEKATRLSGLTDVADRLGINPADFENSTDTVLPEGKILRHAPLCNGVIKADGLVSLSKLKTHAVTRMTGALKNQFGTVFGRHKALYHANFPDLKNFCQMLVDLNQFLKPRLFVMDAIVAMEGNGPRNGHPRSVGAILISTDPVAVDAAGSFLIGMEPSSILLTCLAAKAGLGEIDLEKIETCLIRLKADAVEVRHGQACQLLPGLQVKDFATARAFHSAVNTATVVGVPVFKRFIQRRPVIDARICTRCRICEKACPLDPKAVRQLSRGQIPEFDYLHCIRCFCCQEVCPAGAIKVHKSLIGRIFKF